MTDKINVKCKIELLNIFKIPTCYNIINRYLYCLVLYFVIAVTLTKIFSQLFVSRDLSLYLSQCFKSRTDERRQSAHSETCPNL